MNLAVPVSNLEVFVLLKYVVTLVPNPVLSQTLALLVPPTIPLFSVDPTVALTPIIALPWGLTLECRIVVLFQPMMCCALRTLILSPAGPMAVLTPIFVVQRLLDSLPTTVVRHPIQIPCVPWNMRPSFVDQLLLLWEPLVLTAICAKQRLLGLQNRTAALLQEGKLPAPWKWRL